MLKSPRKGAHHKNSQPGHAEKKIKYSQEKESMRKAPVPGDQCKDGLMQQEKDEAKKVNGA